MTTFTEYRDGSRILRAGDYIKVKGARGLFHLHGFDLDAGSFDAYGGTRGRERWRSFPLDRLGARPVEPNRRANA